MPRQCYKLWHKSCVFVRRGNKILIDLNQYSIKYLRKAFPWHCNIQQGTLHPGVCMEGGSLVRPWVYQCPDCDKERTRPANQVYFCCAQWKSMLPADLPQMPLWSKLVDSRNMNSVSAATDFCCADANFGPCNVYSNPAPFPIQTSFVCLKHV